MINHNSPIPLYKQVKAMIKRQIEAGELKPDQQISSEREICEMYDVSRTTVRQAINEAVNEGMLYRIPGKGTFVAKPKIDQGLFQMSSFTQTIIARGMAPRTEILREEQIPADAQLANILNLEIGEQVVNLTLLGYADDEPVVYYRSFMPASIGKGAALRARAWTKEGRSFSTYELYAGRDNIYPSTTSQTFEAIIAGEEIAEVLKIEKGSPIFKVTSVIYAESKVPLEFKQVYYRGDKFKFNISRRHPYNSERR